MSVPCIDLERVAACVPHGGLYVCCDPASQLKAVIALHDTQCGPALGGCRLRPYASLQQAMEDAVRLAEGMSLKAALSGVALGGGKAVVCQPEGAYDRRALLQSFGRMVHQLGGSYITAVDSGTRQSDMDVLREVTPYVACHAPQAGWMHGDPSEITALGVYHGLVAAASWMWDRPVSSLRVAVQGLGHVGWALAHRLHAAGATLWVSDPQPDLVRAAVACFNAKVVPVDAFYTSEVDVLAPCALGRGLHRGMMGALRAPLIAGGANNQLASWSDGDDLHRLGVVYVPDFVLNAGGLIYAEAQYHTQRHGAASSAAEAQALAKVERIGQTVREVLTRSVAQQRAPVQVALELAAERKRAMHPSSEAAFCTH